jgi:hypothetical protein
MRALEEVMRSDKQIVLATQINASDDDPEPDAIYGMSAPSPTCCSCCACPTAP